MSDIESIFVLSSADKSKIAKLLPVLERELETALREFYAWLETDPKVKKVLDASPHSTADLAKYQKSHWMSLLKNGPDEDFFERAKRIGQVHARIGVTPTWYISAYTFIQQRLQAALGKKSRLSGTGAADLISTLSKVIMFDMQAALSVYTASEEDATKVQTGTAIADDILDSSITVSIATNEASVSSVRMLDGMRRIDERAQAVSAAVEETVTGIQQISETADDVATIAQQADTRANEGANVVSEATERMNEITRVVESTSALVNELSDSSREISEIVNAIDDIASQTNLLALNATIEAARAGEAGKGFAVVASEVKSLSTQTAQATEKIGGRIESLLADMQHIVQSMEEASGAVNHGQESMNRMSETMTELRSNVGDVSSRMEQISVILQEQSLASNEVAQGVSSIAEDSAGSVGQLDQVADSMRKVESQVGTQLQKLTDYDVPNKILRIAKSDHVIWKKRLADMVSGRESLNPDELADHTKCRLGRFYYGDGAAEYRNLPSFKALEEPHREVHKWGIEASRRFADRDLKGALEAIEIVESNSGLVLELLDRTIAEANDRK